MSDRHAAIYLASRVASAVVNAGAVVVFTRTSSATLYGQYLIAFAFCFIIYSFGMQWAVSAHFGRFSAKNGAKVAGALLVLAAAFTVPALAAVAILAWTGTLDGEVAWGTAVLAVSLTAYFAALEIGRSNLLVGASMVATLVRSVLTVILGVLALLWLNTATALLIAVGASYAIGAAVVFAALSRTIWSSGFVWPGWADIMRLLRYGWPLIIAFGATAIALNIDRILLDRVLGAAAVAPYGAVLDFMKQTFLVVAESISVGYISYAKWHYADGRRTAASDALKRAFVAQWYIVVFGTVFFLLMGDAVFGVLFAESYQSVALQVLPILLAGNALLVLRAYHFGQVIYFSNSATLEVAASVLMLLVTSIASYLLIPIHGAVGAAVGFTLGQAAALLLFTAFTPKGQRFPIDWVRAAALTIAGAIMLRINVLVGGIAGTEVALGTSFALLAVVSAGFLFHWNLFDTKLIVRRLQSELGNLIRAR